MFFLDDVLLAPIKGLAAVCRKVYEAAQDDLDGQEKAILADLTELHKMMDVGQIGDDDFNVRENVAVGPPGGLPPRRRQGSPAGSRRKDAGSPTWNLIPPLRRKPTTRSWNCWTAC